MSRPKMPSAFSAPGGAPPQLPQSTPVRPSMVPAPSPNTREGQVNIIVGVDRHRQLKILAATRGVTMRDLVIEALNLLFSRYNLPEIKD